MFHSTITINCRSPYRLRKLACFISLCNDLGLKTFSYKFLNDYFLFLRVESDNNLVIDNFEDRFKSEYKSFILTDESRLYFSQLFEKFKNGVAV